MARRRGPGERAGLDQDQVVAAAKAILGEDGRSGLSVRGVARRLDVAPNAIYGHFTDKAALLDAVLDDVLGEVPDPSPSLDPAEAIEDVMCSCFDALARYPRIVPLFFARQGARGENAHHLGAVVRARLEALGFDSAGAQDLLRMLIVHTVGSVAFAVAADDDRLEAADFAERRKAFTRSLRRMIEAPARP